MSVFCGIDWAEQHHDVALVDATGQLIAKARISDDAAGYRQLLDLLAGHGDTEADPMPVAIETSRGLLVALLRTGTRSLDPYVTEQVLALLTPEAVKVHVQAVTQALADRAAVEKVWQQRRERAQQDVDRARRSYPRPH